MRMSRDEYAKLTGKVYKVDDIDADEPCTDVELELPWAPSVNALYADVCTNCGGKTRRLLTKRGKLYKAEVAGIVMASSLRGLPVQGRLAHTIELYPPDNRWRDVDNPVKVINDALEMGGVIPNDKYIKDLRIVEMNNVKGGKVKSKLRRIGP